MFALYIIFFCIDVLAAIYIFKLAFIERSNMNWKYKRRFTMILSIIVLSLIFRIGNLPLACLIAGLPAVLMTLFLAALLISMFLHKGPWR